MKKLFALAVLSFSITVCLAQKVTTSNFNLDKNGLAIEGYDPVAYFTANKAMEGKKEITLVNNGVTYRFASAKDRELFKADPEKYLPQYGGWCAYAMGATGEKVSIDPETFKLVDGKLYLFYNQFFNNTKKSWNKDEANLKAKADANWIKTNK
ncbi:YHS domain-containing (seleno)protein [Mucilaginibacter sp.]|jgi:YHS domain-containing protein|uniref:YHS domain-containing (seleno)protein n=1 Tax=Mucilaginibacter sp. TaxID=1882438 RepID=UPI003565651F